MPRAGLVKTAAKFTAEDGGRIGGQLKERIILRRTLGIIAIVSLLPAGLHAVIWYGADRPLRWHEARWDSSGLLPPANADNCAHIYFLAARTGGMKGALSKHSWIVLKEKGASSYQRYDKVGWGTPVRQNAWAPDAYWYSNQPEVLLHLSCREADLLLNKVKTAIAKYPHHHRGDYTLWPGPNSNSFVGYVLNSVPELGIALPPLAVGRDYLGENRFLLIDNDLQNAQFNLFGLLGVAIGKRHGFEINFLGLVAGFDVLHPGLKIPGFGTVKL